MRRRDVYQRQLEHLGIVAFLAMFWIGFALIAKAVLW